MCVFRLTVSRSSLWILWKIIWLTCLNSEGERRASEVRFLHTSRLDLSRVGHKHTRHVTLGLQSGVCGAASLTFAPRRTAAAQLEHVSVGAQRLLLVALQ